MIGTRHCQCCGRALDENKPKNARYCKAACRAEAHRLRAVQATLEETTLRHSASRRCENRACGACLAGRRRDARFCSDPCRAEWHRQRAAQEASNGVDGSQVQPGDRRRTEPYWSTAEGMFSTEGAVALAEVGAYARHDMETAPATLTRPGARHERG